MTTALVFKELRETAWIAAVALVLYFFFAAQAVGVDLFSFVRVGPTGIPFVTWDFGGTYLLVSAGLAIALGFAQSVLESMYDTWLFLLHRPMERRRLIAAKLGTGLVLYLACAAIPVIVLAFWAATPGTHASPFEWSMTLVTWWYWLVMTLVYLGAFLSGIRPARWYATRLLPLAAAGALAFVISMIASLIPWWWAIGLPVLLLADLLFVAAIMSAAQLRDFP